MPKKQSKRRRPVKRASLAGWWKCVPFVAVPFCIVFFETWMRTQILTSEYEMNVLSNRTRELRQQTDELQDERFHLRRMERIDAAAPELSLVEPKPGQIVLVRAGKGLSAVEDRSVVAQQPMNDRLEAEVLNQEVVRLAVTPIEPAIEAPRERRTYDLLEPVAPDPLEFAALAEERARNSAGSLDLMEPPVDTASMD